MEKEIKIVSDNKNCADSIRRYLSFNLSETDMKNLILVDVNTVLIPSQKRTDRTGINLAKEYVDDSNNVIIMLSLEKESFLLKNNEHFSALMAYPNVGFCDILALNNIPLIYKELALGHKSKDATGLALYEFHILERKIAVLRHGMHRVNEGKSQCSLWLEEARNAGLSGSDDEIINYVRNWKPETSGAFEGKFLEGVFVDALDTLFDKNWLLNPKVKEAVEKIAFNNDKKIFVISDSPKNLLENKLGFHNILWKNISKYDLRGATLEIVIDNLSKNDFKKTYGINSETFINVSEL